MNPFERWSPAPPPAEAPKVAEKKESIEAAIASKSKGGRLINEDMGYVDLSRGLFGIADGMGGTKFADKASKAVVSSLLESSFEQEKDETLKNVMTAETDTALERENVERALRTLSMERLPNRIRSLPVNADTTISLGKIWRDAEGKKYVTVAHNGDSRIYRFHAGELSLLTKDDSMVQTLIDLNAHDTDGFPLADDQDITRRIGLETIKHLSPREPMLKHLLSFAKELAREEKREVKDLTLEEIRHFVLNSVGSPSNVFIQTYDVNDDDVFFAMSDGVHDNLTDEEIAGIVSRYTDNPKQAAEALVDAAEVRSLEKDHPRAKPDDMTVAVMKA